MKEKRRERLFELAVLLFFLLFVYFAWRDGNMDLVWRVMILWPILAGVQRAHHRNLKH